MKLLFEAFDSSLSDLQSCRIPLVSNTVTDVGEARPEVKKFMTKVDKIETKYDYKKL